MTMASENINPNSFIAQHQQKHAANSFITQPPRKRSPRLHQQNQNNATMIDCSPAASISLFKNVCQRLGAPPLASISSTWEATEQDIQTGGKVPLIGINNLRQLSQRRDHGSLASTSWAAKKLGSAMENKKANQYRSSATDFEHFVKEWLHGKLLPAETDVIDRIRTFLHHQAPVPAQDGPSGVHLPGSPVRSPTSNSIFPVSGCFGGNSPGQKLALDAFDYRQDLERRRGGSCLSEEQHVSPFGLQEDQRLPAKNHSNNAAPSNGSLLRNVQVIQRSPLSELPASGKASSSSGMSDRGGVSDFAQNVMDLATPQENVEQQAEVDAMRELVAKIESKAKCAVSKCVGSAQIQAQARGWLARRNQLKGPCNSLKQNGFATNDSKDRAHAEDQEADEQVWEYDAYPPLIHSSHTFLSNRCGNTILRKTCRMV
jgi:hypothetical protein